MSNPTIINWKLGWLFWRYSFTRIDKKLRWLFGFAVLAVLNYNCRLIKRFSETNLVVGLNEVLVQVCYSIIASFIFYFIYQVYQESKRRIGIIDFVATKSRWMQGMAQWFITDVIVSHSGKPYNQGPSQSRTRSEVLEIFHNFPLQDVKSKIYPNTTYIDSVIKTCDFIETGLKTFLDYGYLFQPEWIECISKIDKNISELRLIYNANGTSLGAYGDKIWPIYFDLEYLASMAREEREKVAPLLKTSKYDSTHANATILV